LSHCHSKNGTNAKQFANGAGAAIKTINATMEVTLAAGAIHTAQLLQLSGIGPSALLESLGVEVVADLPGVGQNFQDHWGVTCYYPCMLLNPCHQTP
jgi:choline dehydrogenase